MKKTMKKAISMAAACAVSMTLLAGCGGAGSASSAAASAPASAAPAASTAAQVDYPTGAVTAVSTFGTASGTYTDAVTISNYAEPLLGQSITVVDHAGGSGVIGTEYVMNQDADGYTLLCGTDSVSLFGAMEMSEATYDDFVPILLSYARTFYLATNPGTGYATLDDLIEAARANPGRITVATTGVTSVPAVWFSILSNYYDVEFNVVEYDGNSDCMTALMGGHVDAFVTNTIGTLTYIETKDIVPLCVFSQNSVDILKDVPVISAAAPDLAPYEGFGNFFQVSVKAGTPQEIIDKLVEVYQEAFNNPEYQEYITSQGNNPLGLYGEEAIAYEKHHQAIASYIMYDTGATTVNPADLGIERVE